MTHKSRFAIFKSLIFWFCRIFRHRFLFWPCFKFTAQYIFTKFNTFFSFIPCKPGPLPCKYCKLYLNFVKFFWSLCNYNCNFLILKVQRLKSYLVRLLQRQKAFASWAGLPCWILQIRKIRAAVCKTALWRRKSAFAAAAIFITAFVIKVCSTNSIFTTEICAAFFIRTGWSIPKA